MKVEKVYIERILYSVSKIESFTKDFDKAKFLADSKTQSAVIMHMALIGENSKKISQETKEKIDLPWKQIAGFRDIAIHDYTNLNLDTIWTAIQKRIPELKEKLMGVK